MKHKDTNKLTRVAMLLLVALFGLTGARAQTLFSEDFEGGSMPAGWTTDGPGTWQVGTGDYSASTGAGQGTYNALIKHSNTDNVTKLITPEIDLSSVASAELSFMYVLREWYGDIDELRVFYRTSSSAEWTLLKEYTTAVTAWTTVEGIVLPNPSSTYQIAFEMTDGYGYGVGIDDIQIVQGLSIPKPIGLSITLTPGDGTVATLSWTESGTATAWEICLNDDESNLIGVSTNPYTLTGLTAETTYTAKVRAVVGSDKSNWSSAITFTPTNAYTITVNDGTATNGYVPIYGFYVDKFSKCQFIIPASDLATIVYGTVNKLTFYASNANVSWGDAEFEVYMTEVENTTFADATLVDWSTMDKVMNAGTLSISGNQMVVTLDAPYQYLGGNLLIGIRQTTSGTYAASYWYGVTTEDNVAIGGYETSKAVSAQKFLPKTTIEYTPGEAPTILKPKGVEVIYEGGTEATVRWISDEDAFDIEVNGEVTEDVENGITLTGLEFATTYTVRVRAKKGTDVSDWSAPVSFTTDLSDDMCQIQLVLQDSYGDGWTGATIVIADVETGIEIGSVTLASGSEGTFTIEVPNGREIQFEWVAGSWDGECSYAAYDVNEIEIFSGSGAMSSAVTYTVNCTVHPWRTPTDLAATIVDPTSAVLSWTENSLTPATSWVIAYMAETDTDYTEITVNSNPFTLEGLTPGTTYYAWVRPNTDVVEAWSDGVAFTAPTYADASPTDLAVTPYPTTADVSWDGFAESYDIEWAEPVASTSTLWLQYDDGTLKSNVGNSSASTWTWGVMYPTATLDGNNVLTKIAFYEVPDNNYTDGSVTVNVYSGGDDAPETLIGTETIATANTNGMREVVLSSPIEFDPSQNLWITLTTTATYCMAMSEQDGGANSRWFLNGDEWVDFGTVYTSGATYSFMIRGFVETIDYSAWAWNSASDVTSPYTITGLKSETEYAVRVKADYGANGESRWSWASFTTPAATSVPVDLAATDVSYTSATLNWTGYQDSYNVRFRKTPVLFRDDFENGLDNWTIIDADGDGYTWVLGSECGGIYLAEGGSLAGSGHNESGDLVVSGSYSNISGVGALTPDNYLVSPQVQLGGSVSFWAKGQDSSYSEEVFGVAVSTTSNTDPSAFTMVGADMTASGTWTKYTFDLSAFEGEGYVAIRHYNVTDMFIFDVDDFTIYAPKEKWNELTTDDSSIELSDLEPNTEYEWQVQGNLTEGTTEWSEMSSFTTLEAPVSVTIGATGYTTFVAPSDVSFPSDVTAFIVTSTTETAVVMEAVESIPAGTAVVVKGAAGTYYLDAASSTDDVTGNLLLASDGTVVGAPNIYALANKDKGVGFYPVASTVTIPEGKAYLEIESKAKAFYGLFEDDATAIDNLNDDANLNETIYNLAGQRINKAQKGVNIINGRKVLK